jgi:microcystin-dependent protein
LRNIKLAIKNTFPNITGEVTKTQAELNAIPANIGDVADEILLHLLPAGSIIQWDIVNKPVIPTGWVECNGQTVSGYGVVPDMRDRFVLSRGSTYTAGNTGGASSVTSGSDGGHTPTIQGTALTAAQIPAHDHSLYVWETGSSSDANNFGTVNAKGLAGNTDGTYGYRSATTVTAGAIKLVENTGAAASSHTHVADAVAAHTHSVATLPPYYVTVFLVKVTSYEAP